jgi:hypothetical protein
LQRARPPPAAHGSRVCSVVCGTFLRERAPRLGRSVCTRALPLTHGSLEK